MDFFANRLFLTHKYSPYRKLDTPIKRYLYHHRNLGSCLLARTDTHFLPLSSQFLCFNPKKGLIMPRLEPDPPLLSSIPTPYDVTGSPTSRVPSPQNAIQPDVDVLSRTTNANRPVKNGVKVTPIYGPRTYASHISHQKDLCKMKRKQKQMKMELAKATVNYRQKKLSNALV